MKNIIALCNTYAQLIVMLQMKMTIFKDEKVSLILSDHSRDADNVVKRFRESDIFENVIYLKTKEIDYANGISLSSLNLVMKGVFGKYFFENEMICTEKFDLFLYFNYSFSANLLFTQFYEKNKNMECARFEEGVTSYNHRINEPDNENVPKKIKILVKLRKIFHKTNIYDKTETFYCYYPEFYTGSLNAVRVPLIREEQIELQNIIREVFDLKEENLEYKQKYIYFACVGDLEGGQPIGEVELAKKIANLVGQDNLLIKVHPRDTSGAFENAGLLVDCNSSKPWEAIQLSMDFSQYIFMSAISSSVLSVNLMMEDAPKSYFLYNLCNVKENTVAQSAIDGIENVIRMSDGALTKVCVVKNSLDEILN